MVTTAWFTQCYQPYKIIVLISQLLPSSLTPYILLPDNLSCFLYEMAGLPKNLIALSSLQKQLSLIQSLNTKVCCSVLAVMSYVAMESMFCLRKYVSI